MTIGARRYMAGLGMEIVSSADPKPALVPLANMLVCHAPLPGPMFGSNISLPSVA